MDDENDEPVTQEVSTTETDTTQNTASDTTTTETTIDEASTTYDPFSSTSEFASAMEGLGESTASDGYAPEVDDNMISSDEEAAELLSSQASSSTIDPSVS